MTKIWHCFCAQIHESWFIVSFAIGVVVGAVLLQFIQTAILPGLVIAMILLSLFSLVVRRRFMLIFTFLLGVVVIFMRSSINVKLASEPLGSAVRDLFAAQIKNAMPEAEAGLGLGYVLGIKDTLPRYLLDELRIVGMSHIVVVSGTHLGIVAGGAKKAFRKISRRLAMVAGILAVIGYLYLVGFTPSMLRAGFVVIIGTVAWMYGLKVMPWRVILFAMAITLINNPGFVVSLSWQLSFLAFVSVSVLVPRVQKKLYGKKRPNFVASTLIVSLVTGIASAPLLVYYFGQISLISVLANLLILPTIPLAMVTTFLVGASSVIGGVVHLAFGKIATVILDYHIWVVDWLSKYDYFLIEIDKKNPLVLLCYIPVVVLTLYVVMREKTNFRYDRIKYRSRRPQCHQRE